MQLFKLGGAAQSNMKLRVDPYKLFFYLAVIITFAIGLLGDGIEGQKWTQRFKPFGQFSMGL